MSCHDKAVMTSANIQKKFGWRYFVFQTVYALTL